MRGIVSSILVLALLLQCTQTAVGRKHKLHLDDERRRFFVVSDFGLVLGGTIAIQVSNVKINEPVEGIGFAFHRMSPDRVQYMLETMDVCIFSNTAEISPSTMRFPFHLDQLTFQSWGSALEELPGVNHSSSVINNGTTHEVVLSLDEASAEDLYSVSFHICNIGVPSVDIDISIVEVNPGPDYLGAGLKELPTVFGVTSSFFIICFIIWVYILWKNRASPNLFRIHFIMLLLVLVKALSSAFHAVDYHFIEVAGTEEEGWAITFYVINFAKGMLLFLTVLLVGVGYGVIKNILSEQEKRLFLFVLPLQVFANIAAIIIEESSEGSRTQSTWRIIAFSVDLVCCGAILFPIVWSIDHLKGTMSVDGKAAVSLKKLKMFRRFYILVLGYIYVTRIIMYFVSNTLPFRVRFLSYLVTELITLVVYVITGWLFSPSASNAYVELTKDDYEEGEMYEMDTVTSTTATTEGLRKIRRPKIDGRDELEESLMTQNNRL